MVYVVLAALAVLVTTRRTTKPISKAKPPATVAANAAIILG
jgi:hypothetical protein